MKLYKITVKHAAPKDSHTATETLIEAEHDEAVYSWIDKEKCYGGWTESCTPEDNEEPEVFYFGEDYDTEYGFKEWCIKSKGDLDDERGYEDAYYGVTKWGWSEVEGATPADVVRLKELGLCISLSNEKDNHE